MPEYITIWTAAGSWYGSTWWPGLLYSLTMSDGASQSALLDMAQQLYTPAQGDVG
jgi:hypothetical protein